MMQYGLIGEKLGHSYSKEIHEFLCSYNYELCEISTDNLKGFIEKRDFRAINVTIPYKQSVMPYLDYIAEDALQIGAVNTVLNNGGKLYGYNTDCYGLTALIKRVGIDIKGKKVLILGSGGTSKTANFVVRQLGASEVITVSRSPSEGMASYDDAYEIHRDAQIIINTTPCGMYPQSNACPIVLEKFAHLEGVVDVIYNPLETMLVQSAKRRGITATGGLYMLVAQAAKAAEYFTDTKISADNIEKVYRKIFSDKRNVVLIGMPGSGKTTIGKILAKMLGRQFIDTDALIETEEKCAIKEIFGRVGENGFRDIESRVIENVSKKSGAVIATGGGAVLRDENVRLLKGNSVVYFIDRPIEDIVATPDRPLSSNREDLEKRYRERYPIYCAAADKKIDNLRDASAAADAIKEDLCL